MKTWIKVSVIITYIAMIATNALANILPINGLTTGEVSDSFENLFAPAGLTFSIWGLIYLLLGLYSLYQAGLFRDNNRRVKLLNSVGIIFSISSIANAAWIFSWHYKVLSLSILLMLVILISLITIVKKINKEKLFISLPFSIYFGWITVATIANITAFLVDIGWNRFGISEVFWTITIIIVGAIIAIVTILKNRDFAYGLVIIWAYAGILIKHLSESGFNSMYPSIITTVIGAIIIVSIVDLFVLIRAVRS